MASNYILKELRDRDIKARRGYINDVGEYVPYEKDQSGGRREGRKSESFTYIPPAMKKRQAKREAMLKEIEETESKNRKAKKKYLEEATPEEKLYPDIYTARKKRESQSKYFPQTGTRSDEEKGFFSGLYDKTIGEYQRGQDEKERLKEETKAAMAAEPDPFVKKEIARKGHAEYMKIAATGGQGERNRETMGSDALALKKKRELMEEQKNKHAGQFKAYNRADEPQEEEGMIARALRKGGEGIDSIKDHLSGATAHKEGAEAAYAPHQGMGVDRRLQEAADEKKAPWAKLREDEIAKEKADALINQETTLDSREMDSEALDDWRQDKASDLTSRLDEAEGGFEELRQRKMAEEMADTELATAKDDEARRLERKNESGIEGIGTQEQAQEAIASLDEEEAEETVDIIKREKGQGEEWIDAKEAIRDKNGRQRYVRYEGSGLHIDMSLLEKDIDRNHFFKNILPNTPPESRLALMAERNYISDKDLTVAQKKSAKQIKELEILNLEASKLKTEAEKASRALSPEKKLKYEQSMIGFRQATKDKDWDTATLYASQMREMGMPLSEFDPVALQAASDAKLLGKHPPMISIAKKYGIMSASGKPSVLPFYKQQGALSLKLSFLGKDASSGGGTLDLNEKIHTGSKITFGEILNYNGIETWDKVKGRIDKGANDPTSIALAKSMGLESLKGISREAYLHYAKSKAHDVISRSVWGPAYDEIKQAGIRSRDTFSKEAQKNFSESQTVVMEPPWKKSEPDANLRKMAKERVVTNKADAKAKKIKAEKKAAEKVKASKNKAHEDEITKYNSTAPAGRGVRQKSNPEKKADFMRKGSKRLDALVKGVKIAGQKKGVSGQPRFNSREEAIKFYKNDPKGKKLLEKMGLPFRHFILQK